LEENKSDDAIAADYEKVAREFIDKGEYSKAEDYFDRARKLYVKNNNKEKIAYIEREIAKVQELQDNLNAAIVSYKNASRLSQDNLLKEINNNDAQRLQNISNPQKQSTYIQKNIDLLNTVPTDNDEDRAIAFSQMAQVNVEMDNKEEAVSNLQSALEVSQKPSQSIQMKREIANIYASKDDIDKAIEVNEQILEEAEQTQDTKVQIEQLRTLSSNYAEKQQLSKSIASLQQAYQLALQEGNTLEAKNSLELLVTKYQKENNNKKALAVYADFISKLEPLVKSDSTLIDEKAFLVHEEKIAQLERERELKDELIRKKNITNYILIVSIVLIFISLIIIVKVLYSVMMKNKKIALQSLRREMNPHFIFNSLNSVNQFIAQNNELEANKYLTSYSRLMRNMMENSNKDFTPLSTELEQLKEYLDLEYMRFHDKFTYQINMDENIDTDVLIPNMLIQPQLENAIWHGLRYRESKGILQLNITQKDNNIYVVIDDNGIGLQKSKELKTKHQKVHQSRGLSNTIERIQLLNSLYNCKITMNIKDKQDEEGVIVSYCFPIKDIKK